MVAIKPRSNPGKPPDGVHGLVRRSRMAAKMPVAMEMRRDEQAQALVEMAVVLSAFFLLLFGIFSFAIVFCGRGNAICAANMAARYAALHSSTAITPATTASIQSYALGYLGTAPASTTTVTPTYSPSNTVGSTVTVTVTLVYPTHIPFHGIGNITVVGTSQRTITR